MIIEPLALPGAFLVRMDPQQDERGFFARAFCQKEFRQHGLDADFPQHSVSFNKVRGTLRGLHYQASPHGETKVVRCTRGRIHDVVVDIRAGSATRGKWLGCELSADNGFSLYIPGGFAHGFITLEDNTEVHYMINREHAPGHGRAIRWNDPDLNITWPLQPLVMSAHDRDAPFLRAHQNS